MAPMPPRRRYGQAPALRAVQWRKWLDWLKNHAGARTYLVIFLTGALGLRCSEALALKREDLCLGAAIPKVVVTGDTNGAKKSPGDVYVRKQHMDQLRGFLRDGVYAKRSRSHKHGKGPKKQVSFTEHFIIPGEGYIFRARANACKGHLHYQAVYSHIKREALRFAKFLKDECQPVSPEVMKLRPHSGRATLITELMGEGMTTALSMKYARHSPDSFKVHLKYGRLTLEDVKQACDVLSQSRKRGRWSTWATKDLLRAQKEITMELEQRTLSLR